MEILYREQAAKSNIISMEDKQAFKQASYETIAAPGGRMTRVIRPARDMPPDSKRADIIERAEDDLENEMDVLKEGTRQRNIEIQQKLDEIREQGRVWETKLQTEINRRDESIGAARDTFAHTFRSFRSTYETETNARFDAINAATLPPQDQRETQLNQSFRAFVDVQVPGIIEELQGSVTRQLKKSHETFDIDNTKLLKREKRIVERFEHHKKATGNQFDVEKHKRMEKFLDFEEETIETIRVDDRQSEQVQCSTVEAVRAVRAELQAERDIREREDLEILGKLAEAMAKLQQSILSNFGQTEN